MTTEAERIAPTGLCPYCGSPVNVDPEIEDDWGRLMCADCHVADEGRCEPYRIEGAWVYPEMPEHLLLAEAREREAGRG